MPDYHQQLLDYELSSTFIITTANNSYFMYRHYNVVITGCLCVCVCVGGGGRDVCITGISIKPQVKS